MFNILVITSQDETRHRIAGLLTEGTCKLTFREAPAAARTLIRQGIFDAVLMAPSAATEHTLDEIRAVRRLNRALPVVLALTIAPLDWEEAALGCGADLILREPFAAAHLEQALHRFAPPEPDPPAAPAPELLPTQFSPVTRGALEILRDFSHILGYSLNHKMFVEQFVEKVREIVGVSRLALFLETPGKGNDSPDGEKRLSCAASIGISTEVLDCFELSRADGIGRRMLRTPQIIVASGEGSNLLARRDAKAQREFDVLGCNVAIPITDRTRTLGVAMLGIHLTGRAFTPEELQLLYLLMEELGSAIKNTWLHQQLSGSHRLLADVLGSLSSGCMVVDRNLQVLHANRAMVSFIKKETAADANLEFADLPQKLAGSLYDAAVKGTKPEPFFFTAGKNSERLFHIAITVFPGPDGEPPHSAMMVMEDFTQIEAAKQFEIEASKAKLIALIAKRFAHEIRNSLVPLATHEQLLESEYENDDFRRSLKTALMRETGRIQRFTEQMLYLAQPARTPDETTDIRDLIDQCFHRVSGQAAPAGRLQLRSEADLPLVRCHRAALEHAFQEILTNCLQANPENPVVSAHIEPGTNGGINIALRDTGKGFSAETAARALEPFYTTRNTGVGLGLTVARKIIEDHHGRLRINARSGREDFDVQVWLPEAE